MRFETFQIHFCIGWERPQCRCFLWYDRWCKARKSNYKQIRKVDVSFWCIYENFMVHLKCVADIPPLKCFKGVLEFISGRKSSKENYFVLKHKVRCLNLNLLIRHITFALYVEAPRLTKWYNSSFSSKHTETGIIWKSKLISTLDNKNKISNSDLKVFSYFIYISMLKKEK